MTFGWVVLLSFEPTATRIARRIETMMKRFVSWVLQSDDTVV